MEIGLFSTQVLDTPPKKYGGLEMVVSDLANYYDELGHTVHLFATKGSKKPKHGKLYWNAEAGMNIHPMEDWEMMLANHEDLLKELDIIHDHTHFRAPAYVKAQGLNKNYMYSAHAPGVRPVPFPSKTNKFNVVGLSFSHSEYISNYYGFGVRTVYNGVDLSRYEYQEEKGDRLLFVSRIYSPKGPDIAIEIAEKAKMPIDIVGGPGVGTYDKEYYDRVVARCEESNYAEFLGEVSHKKKLELYKNAKGVVMPVRRWELDDRGYELNQWLEPFGLISIEANACGTPILVTPNGGWLETTRHGYNGFLFNSPDEAVYYAKRLNEISPKDCLENAKRFSVERMGDEYLKLYKEIQRGIEW